MKISQVRELHKIMSEKYPNLNYGGCGLFAYAFVSRVGGVGLRCVSGFGTSDKKTFRKSGEVSTYSSCAHVVVSYKGCLLDGHQFGRKQDKRIAIGPRQFKIHDQVKKHELATMVMEGSWRSDFFSSIGGNNRGDVIWTFLNDFDRILLDIR